MARSFADEMTIDPETGLPALPDGFAWKVERVSDWLVVQLAKRQEEKLGFWAELFGKSPIVTWDDYYTDGSCCYEHVKDTTKDGVLAAAVSVYDKVHVVATRLSELDDLVGLYPPKTIL